MIPQKIANILSKLLATKCIFKLESQTSQFLLITTRGSICQIELLWAESYDNVSTYTEMKTVNTQHMKST